MIMMLTRLSNTVGLHTLVASSTKSANINPFICCHHFYEKYVYRRS